MGYYKLKVYQDKSKKKEWRWQIKSRNGKIEHASTEGFTSRRGCQLNLLRLVKIMKRLDSSLLKMGDEISTI